jgi:hypothetical protein
LNEDDASAIDCHIAEIGDQQFELIINSPDPNDSTRISTLKATKLFKITPQQRYNIMSHALSYTKTMFQLMTICLLLINFFSAMLGLIDYIPPTLSNNHSIT